MDRLERALVGCRDHPRLSHIFRGMQCLHWTWRGLNPKQSPANHFAQTCVVLVWSAGNCGAHSLLQFSLFFPSLGPSTFYFLFLNSPIDSCYTKNLALTRLEHHSLGFCPTTDPDAGNYSPPCLRLAFNLVPPAYSGARKRTPLQTSSRHLFTIVFNLRKQL